MVTIWEGALAPEKYVLVLSSSPEDGIDLSTVTAAEFVVQAPAPASTQSTWDATYAYDSTTQTLRLTHVFHATTSELNKPGLWTVYAKLTTPDGTARSRPRPIKVVARFESSL